MKSKSLLEGLIEKGWLLPFFEESRKDDSMIIKPLQLPVITYPYEWSFDQLKAAALLTIDLHIECLEKGFWLRDSSAYNVQFIGHRPFFIDHLSFGPIEENKPWPAYKQFCQHFLAPLLLMSEVDLRLGELFKHHLDGVPLDLAVKLLPGRLKLSPGVLMHIFIHSWAQKKYASSGISASKSSQHKKITLHSLKAIADSLKQTTSKLSLPKAQTEWGNYYDFHNYTGGAHDQKFQIIEEMGLKVDPKLVWDLGANDGRFSRIFSQKKIPTVSWDIDPIAVEKNYLNSKVENDEYRYAALMDLTNPSPSIGWNLSERSSLVERGPVDLVLALALIHHIAIGNNVPLDMFCAFIKRISKHSIIEFVPKSDSQIVKMLSSREDIFSNYNQADFEVILKNHFTILEKKHIENSERTVYLLKS